MSRPSAFYCFHRKQFKVVCVRLFQILVMFALFAASSFAYDVAIKVTVAQDTLAVGTNVTIVKDGIALYSAKAGMDGVASFQLNDGSYFVVLERGGYPKYVSVLEVSGSTNVTRTMSQGISYASAYGQINGPADFSGVSIGAFLNGNIVKRLSPNSGGYYVMSFLPEGEYEFVFTAPGFDEKKSIVSLRSAEFAELNAKLSKTAVAPVEPPPMKAPSTVPAKSVIEVLITDKGQAIAGAKVQVQTPAGSFEAISGTDGIARVNAVQPGEYKFVYGALSATTIVPKETGQAPVAPPVVVEPEPQAPVQQPQQQGNGLAAGLALVGVAGLIVAIGIVVFVMSRMGGKKKPEQATHEMATDEAKPVEEVPAHVEKHAKHEHEYHTHAHKHKK